jgi:hypothetical protein
MADGAECKCSVANADSVEGADEKRVLRQVGVEFCAGEGRVCGGVSLIVEGLPL